MLFSKPGDPCTQLVWIWSPNAVACSAGTNVWSGKSDFQMVVIKMNYYDTLCHIMIIMNIYDHFEQI
jgi:hypothetical protein